MEKLQIKINKLLLALREEQLKTDGLLSELYNSKSDPFNKEAQEKYRQLKKKLIMANMELLKLNAKLKQ